MTIIYSGEQLYDLIPQRPPVVMIDAVTESDDHAIGTAMTITNDNIFVRGSYLEEAGLIEHIAQTAAALAGYETAIQHLPPKQGYIGEVKNFECHAVPGVGDTIYTWMEVVARMEGVTLVQAKTLLGEQRIAGCQMKIFIKDENN